jgi:hypothetical protein
MTDCCITTTNNNNIVDLNSALSLSPMVTSLIIFDKSLPIKNLEELLSQSPRLVHLKLESRRAILDSMFDGFYWEQFIRNTLPSLKTFQIFFSYYFVDEDNPPNLHTLINPFRTPFWIQEKRWLITCDYVIRLNAIRIYTTPTIINNSDHSLRCELSSMNNTYRLTTQSTNEIADDNANQVSTKKYAKNAL